MEDSIKIYIKEDEPHTEDPNPDSNLVFLDKDGIYYEVNSLVWHENEICQSGWVLRSAIRKNIQGRTRAILVAI